VSRGEVLFIDTPTSPVQLTDLQTLISARKRRVLERLVSQGALACLCLRYPPARSYKTFLLQLAAEARAQGFEPRYFNTVHSEPDALEHLPAPDLVVFSDTTPQLGEILELAGRARRRWPGTTVMVGGPHSSADPGVIIGSRNVDLVVRGEGDRVFPEILRRLGTEDLGRLPGVVTRSTGRPEEVTPAPSLANLDEARSPAYDLLPGGLAAFHAYLVTTRGCPFGCPYCFQGSQGPTFRAQSTGRTWEELLLAQREIGGAYDVINLSDDNLTFGNHARLQDLARTRPAAFSLRLIGELRLSEVGPAALNALASLGTVQINFGIESLAPEVQARIGKVFSVREVERRLLEVKRAFGGTLFTKAYFMVGLPGETWGTLHETVQGAICLVESGALDFASFRLFKPLPGSMIFERRKEFGVELAFRDWGDFDRYVFPPVHSTREMDALEIFVGYLAVEARLLAFYEKHLGLPAMEGMDLEASRQEFGKMVGILV
jgi:radical SAM superfamily enzyme YgiQ (UPF0313 family)